jgi:hypothetical protein
VTTFAPPPKLEDVLANRRWRYRTRPFPHLVARDVFSLEFFSELRQAYEEILANGLSDTRDPARFSRNMPNSDAYAWNFPPALEGSLAIFYTRRWHDMLARLLDVPATGDVNGALHHHHPGSSNGFVHGDLGPGWFTDQPRPDGINPMDLERCSYTSGKVYVADAQARETIRAITMIFYLGNKGWSPGDGGETGLYAAKDTPVEQPVALAPPIDNSILVFENTPASYHSFLTNRRRPRGSAILWLHRPRGDVVARWGVQPAHQWGKRRAVRTALAVGEG